MKGIREPTEKEISILSGEIDVLFNDPYQEPPTVCPRCKQKLIKSKKRVEFVIGTKIHVRNLICKRCGFGLIVEE